MDTNIFNLRGLMVKHRNKQIAERDEEIRALKAQVAGLKHGRDMEAEALRARIRMLEELVNNDE